MQDRVIQLNKKPIIKSKCVVYLMSRDQRVKDNHALLYAQAISIEQNLPLVVVFNLFPSLGVRKYEHFSFMLSGLEILAAELSDYNIPFIITSEQTSESLAEAIDQLGASAVYLDFSPLHRPRRFAKSLATILDCNVCVIDTHNIIPVWVASKKQEFAAHTLRTKVHKLLEEYLIEPDVLNKQKPFQPSHRVGISFEDAWRQIEKLPRNGIKVEVTPGSSFALNHLNKFITEKLDSYAHKRNDIAHDNQSGLSPYLHYGQISSLRVALEVIKTTNKSPLLFEQARMPQASELTSSYDGMNTLFEEMIVRKELADNFCLYSPSYNSINSIAQWARKTLDDHAGDGREFVYTLDTLEAAKTHDEAWNASQLQLKSTGKIHGYMRMYWAKKILEWSPSASVAISNCIYLNDSYSIDGGDPSGYVGILWSVGGLHDRPWIERPIFGKIRYMNQEGLRRKFDLDTYINHWNAKS
jgi:deoxyribodipyrimidine photo-lyase